MFCNYCGEENPDDSLFCSSCGAEVKRRQPSFRETQPPPAPPPSEMKATGEPEASDVHNQAPPAPTPLETKATPEPDTSDVHPSLEISQQSVRNKQAPLTICPQCGAVYPSEADGCPDCASLRQAQSSSSPTTTIASMWQRFSAYFADLIVIYLIVLACYILSGALRKPLPSDRVSYELVFLVCLFVYMIIAQTAYHTTLGKYAVGLEVRSARQEQSYPSFWRILFRETIGRLFSSFFFGLGYWMALRDPRRQAWSDQMADTVVRTRPTRSIIRRSLTAFIAIAFVADVAMIGWGESYKTREKRYKDFQTQFQIDAAQVSATRKAVRQAEGQNPRSIVEFQDQMQALLPLLDRYDASLNAIQGLLKEALKEKVFTSETEGRQYAALERVFVVREQESQKKREEANLVISYKPATERWATVESSLTMLDSDIHALDRQASDILAKNGLQ